MKKRLEAHTAKSPIEEDETAWADLSALKKNDLGALKKERERLMNALEKVRKRQKRLQLQARRLWITAKTLDCVLVRLLSEPEYLKRDE